MIRREFLKLGLAVGAAGLTDGRSLAQQNKMLEYLCSPDGLAPDLLSRPSPKSTPFVARLNVPPIKQPLVQPLTPPPDAHAHQRYQEFAPKKFYEIHEGEFLWHHHPEPPYDKGSWAWGFDGITPGP